MAGSQGAWSASRNAALSAKGTNSVRLVRARFIRQSRSFLLVCKHDGQCLVARLADRVQRFVFLALPTMRNRVPFVCSDELNHANENLRLDPGASLWIFRNGPHRRRCSLGAKFRWCGLRDLRLFEKHDRVAPRSNIAAAESQGLWCSGGRCRWLGGQPTRVANTIGL
jgi:hypothetical protein